MNHEFVNSHLSPVRGPFHCLARTAESTHCKGFWSQEDTADRLWFDCAWSQGSRDQRMGCLGDPWILATHQGRVVLETLLDLEERREIGFPSHRQVPLKGSKQDQSNTTTHFLLAALAFLFYIQPHDVL